MDDITNKKWLYGLIVILSQTFNPDYKGPSFHFKTKSVPIEKQIFNAVEEMPYLPGCEEMPDKYERKRCSDNKILDYLDKERKENGGERKVTIKFIIEKDGSISYAEPFANENQICKTEALRSIKSMPKWIPGKQKGKPVRVEFILYMTCNN